MRFTFIYGSGSVNSLLSLGLGVELVLRDRLPGRPPRTPIPFGDIGWCGEGERVPVITFNLAKQQKEFTKRSMSEVWMCQSVRLSF